MIAHIAVVHRVRARPVIKLGRGKRGRKKLLEQRARAAAVARRRG